MVCLKNSKYVGLFIFLVKVRFTRTGAFSIRVCGEEAATNCQMLSRCQRNKYSLFKMLDRLEAPVFDLIREKIDTA